MTGTGTEPHLLLVHGWGFGPGLWRPLLRALPQRPAHLVDLGFFGPPRPPPPLDRPFIALGHSLGFLWLMRHAATPAFATWCRGMVSLNGFTRFAAAADFPWGVPPRILQRMARRLAVDPAGVLDDFRRQGGLDRALPIPSNPQVTTLTAGLNQLAAWDARPELSVWPGPLLAIAAADDAIVSPAMSRALFPPESLVWLPDGGHLLPLTRPKECAARITAFFGP